MVKKTRAKPALSIIDACRDPAIFGPWFKDLATWSAWFTFLAVLFGLPLTTEQLETFRKHTGRKEPAPGGYLSATLVIGRRGGKSLIMAVIAAYLACFFNWRPYLTGGEAGVIVIVAADRRTAGVTMGYLRELLSIDLLKRKIVRETADIIELSGNIVIEVVTPNFKSIRGRTVIAAICDELAFWDTDESAASPDTAVVGALEPAMATIPRAMMLKASSPYARRGVLWDDYDRYFGKDDASTLVWQAATREMNPSVSQAFIDAKYDADPASASAEYGGSFRSDIQSAFSRDAVSACVVKGRFELPPVSGLTYYGFCDPSGGSNDSMTLCIAHNEKEHSVIDVIREVVPPFSPESVVEDFSTILKRYNLNSVTSDRYAGLWVPERFRMHGIACMQAAKPKSDLYHDLLPAINAGRVELLDHAKAVTQICGLERRVARGGRDSIDHGPRGHDDIANVIAGAVCGTAIAQGGAAGWVEWMRWQVEGVPPGRGGRSLPSWIDVDDIRPSVEHGWNFTSEPLVKVFVPQNVTGFVNGRPVSHRIEGKLAVEMTWDQAKERLKHHQWAILNEELVERLSMENNTND
jgi:hypothetical protein